MEILEERTPFDNNYKLKILGLEGDFRYFRSFLGALFYDIKSSRWRGITLGYHDGKEYRKWGSVTAIRLGRLKEKLDEEIVLDMNKEYLEWGEERKKRIRQRRAITGWPIN
ncbi:MAG: hypothetical protein ACJAZS_000626 [Alteromonas naphthalenivorans]|jgi:hypothetical protein